MSEKFALISVSTTHKPGGKTEHEHIYRIALSVLTDDPFVALRAPEVPRMLELHPYDFGAVVQEKAASRTAEDAHCWLVKVRYSSEPISQAQQDRERYPNPLDRPPEISWDYQLFQKPIDRSIDKPIPYWIANNNREHYDPLPEIDDVRPVCTIKTCEASFTASEQVKYGNSVNAKPFMGAPAKSARMMPAKGVRKIEGEVVYWEVTREVHFSRDGHQIRLTHMGFKARPTPEAAPVRLRDELGVYLTQPVLLAENGTKLPDGQAPFVQEFKGYPEVDWTPLKLERRA